MSDMFDHQSTKLPFFKGDIPIIVETDNHAAIEEIENWPKSLKNDVEEACFRMYQDKVEMIGTETLPRIRRAAEVWKHIVVDCIRIDPKIKDAMVIGIKPAWEVEHDAELCIRKNKLVYAGQFLFYPPNTYGSIRDGNFAREK